MGTTLSFNLCCQGREGNREAVLPLPAMPQFPYAQPVAPEPASAPLGIPSPPATPVLPSSTGGWEKPWQPETKLGLS